MSSAKRGISLYLKYVSVNLQSIMQYKLSFVLMVIGRFLVDFGGFLGISFLFATFQNIKGYTYGEVMLCFGLVRLSFSVAECVSTGFSSFSAAVKRGDFDRILVRPRSTILQVIGMRFDLVRIGPMFTAVIMIGVGIMNCRIEWTVGRGFTVVLMVLAGIGLFTGLFMIGATVCFFALEDSGCVNLLTYGAKEHGKYPIDVYGNEMMRFCTCVIPYTLVQYYPLQYVFGKSDCWWYGLYPVGTVGFLLICYGFWRFGVAHYKSSGS